VSRVFMASFSMLLFVAAALAFLSGAHQAAAQTPTPTPPCRPSPTPGTGTVVYFVSATLPAGAGQNANAVCINCTSGPPGQNNTAVLNTNAAGCVSPPVIPVVGAGGNSVWADWATSCVAPGDKVVIQFKGNWPPVTVNNVEWRLADGGVIAGTSSIHGSKVGGLAELPDVSGSSGPPWALLAGGLAAVLALTAGALYARRRWAR